MIQVILLVLVDDVQIQKIGGSTVFNIIGGDTINYTVSTRGYSDTEGTLTVTQNQIINVPLTPREFPFDLSYPFTDEYTDELISDNVFVVNDTLQAITSPLTTAHNAQYNGYFHFQTPSTGTYTLYVTGYYSSESSCDYGAVYCGTAIYNMTRSQIRGGTTDGNGQYLFRGAGSGSSNTYSMILQSDTVYYLNFAYTKDISVNRNKDKLIVTRIWIELT